MKTLNLIAGTLLLSTLFFSCNKNESAPTEQNRILEDHEIARLHQMN